MNKDFISVVPSKFNSRIDSLLNICGLQERKITDEYCYSDKLLNPINYSQVNIKLGNERAKSIKFIESTILQ